MIGPMTDQQLESLDRRLRGRQTPDLAWLYWAEWERLRERLRLAEERVEIAEGYIRSEVWDHYDDAWRAALDRVNSSDETWTC